MYFEGFNYFFLQLSIAVMIKKLFAMARQTIMEDSTDLVKFNNKVHKSNFSLFIVQSITNNISLYTCAFSKCLYLLQSEEG